MASKKISVVVGYHNRQRQLNNTLESLAKSKYDNFDVVIVDHNSEKSIILPETPFAVKVIEVKNKQWTGYSPVFNIGFNYALKNGAEIIIIQSAECYHKGDIISYASNITDGSYIAFGCFRLDKFTSLDEADKIIENCISYVTFDGGVELLGQTAWWNHPIYYPNPLHWCSAITANDLIKLNGFDERFTFGYAHEDGHFVNQVKKAGLKIEIIASPYVIHQWHEHDDVDNKQELVNKNWKLYETLAQEENYKAKHIFTPDFKDNKWHLKVPKIMHCYWGSDLLPYIRYATITSFMQHNPDWMVVLWTTKRTLITKSWGSSGHKFSVECDDFSSQLFNLPIEIKEMDFSQFGFDNTISEVHKSNIINYHALATMGGVWADMDIIFFESLDHLSVNTPENKDKDTFVCIGSYGHSGGFYLASANNKYFANLLSLCKGEYNPKAYQCLGPTLCNKYFPTIDTVVKISPVVNIGMEAVYAHNCYHVTDMIDGSPALFTKGSVGLHWYGGHAQWSGFFKSTNGGLVNLSNNIIGNLLRSLVTPLPKSPKDMKISIVMAYYNRQNLLDKTMESIRRSVITNYEVIIVDDASDIPLVCDGTKIIRIEKENKWYTNCCIPYNMGFRAATGDIVLIQNPECYHVGDILDYVVSHIKYNTYLSFGCYAINKTETVDFQEKGTFPAIGNYMIDERKNGWYNHSTYRPVAYHFCSAIMKRDLNRVGGFDEIYALGCCFDDDDFIRTIKRMGMEVRIIDNPYVIHQHHHHFELGNVERFRVLHSRNQSLYSHKYDSVPPVAPASHTTKSTNRHHSLNRHAGLSRRQLNRMHREQHPPQPRRQPKKPGR